ncbi:MAG: c-type cytochrome biogenesis protein CcsB, partial [Dermabacter sp.]|nr:c-type cytochrome biogenesis protein CcsB [Dermabacter sp.]
MNFQQLAAASDFFILLAMVVYMMAFVAFAIDLAKAVRVRSDVRLAKKARERELATVGAPASSNFAGSAPAADLDLSDGADDAEAELTPARGMSPLSFALGAATIATAFQLLGVIARGIATQRVPWGNMYEFSMTGAAVIMAIFLLLAHRVRDMRRLGLFVLT